MKILLSMIAVGVLFIIAWEATTVRILEQKQLEILTQINSYLLESDITITPL